MTSTSQSFSVTQALSDQFSANPGLTVFRFLIFVACSLDCIVYGTVLMGGIRLMTRFGQTVGLLFFGLLIMIYQGTNAPTYATALLPSLYNETRTLFIISLFYIWGSRFITALFPYIALAYTRKPTARMDVLAIRKRIQDRLVANNLPPIMVIMVVEDDTSVNQILSSIQALTKNIYAEHLMNVHIVFDTDDLDVYSSVLTALNYDATMQKYPTRTQIVYEKINFIVSRYDGYGRCHAQARAVHEIPQIFKAVPEKLCILFMDDHVLLKADCLFQLVQTCESAPDAICSANLIAQAKQGVVTDMECDWDAIHRLKRLQRGTEFSKPLASVALVNWTTLSELQAAFYKQHPTDALRLLSKAYRQGYLELLMLESPSATPSVVCPWAEGRSYEASWFYVMKHAISRQQYEIALLARSATWRRSAYTSFCLAWEVVTHTSGLFMYPLLLSPGLGDFLGIIIFVEIVLYLLEWNGVMLATYPHRQYKLALSYLMLSIAVPWTRLLGWTIYLFPNAVDKRRPAVQQRTAAVGPHDVERNGLFPELAPYDDKFGKIATQHEDNESSKKLSLAAPPLGKGHEAAITAMHRNIPTVQTGDNVRLSRTDSMRSIRTTETKSNEPAGAIAGGEGLSRTLSRSNRDLRAGTSLSRSNSFVIRGRSESHSSLRADQP